MVTRLSVIIPSRDRPGLLSDLMDTLQRQRVEASQVEILVVDDGSVEELEPVVARAAGPISTRCVRQRPAGLNVARNRGVSETKGDLVAFLDDDTLLAPDWASAVIGAFEDAECAGIAGRVRLRFEGPIPAWLSRSQRSYLAELDLGEQPRWLDEGLVPVGANCAVRRSELERVGGFRAGLDRVATSLISNGDTEFFRRLRDRGGRLRYEPQAHADHRVPADRLTQRFFRRRAHAQGLSDALLARLETTRPLPLMIGREAWRLGRTAPILVRGLVTGQGPMNAIQWLYYCRGRFYGTVHNGDL